MKRAAHRPARSYPGAPVYRSQVALEECPFCEAHLISTGWREVDKYVQTLNGPQHVIGYSRKCSNAECPQPQARYHAPAAEKLSLPHVTYGLDVMAYIAQRRNGEQKQFKEIWRELETEYEIEISEREVGRLYRKIEALLLGNQIAIRQALTSAVEQYGQLIMAVDGLQPEGGGPKLYILHEVLSETVMSVALIDQASEENLSAWLAPHQEWSGAVKATLSDNEAALVAALKTTWPEAAHQVCQMHFVKALSEPVHAADRDLQQALRDTMGQLPPVPGLKRESETEAAGEDVSPSDLGMAESQAPPRPLSAALMQALDVVSGVELEAMDTLSPAAWEDRLGESPGTPPVSEAATAPVAATTEADGQPEGETLTPDYLSASETVAWLRQTLLAQVPASARPLVEAPPEEPAVTYWEHTAYRRAIQDARHRGRRKPFVCGGLRGYDQLRAIVDHLTARQAAEGLDPYLSQLLECAQRAVAQTQPRADAVRQAQQWLVRVERLLADPPAAKVAQPASTLQRQRMRDLLSECERQAAAPPTVQALQHTWRRLLEAWEPDLYHCYDIEGLPRSNLGLEALLGQARRQQRRLAGQADTSPLATTGQGDLRTPAAGQAAHLALFHQVPTWVYRLAAHCTEAVEAGVRWPRQLHRDASAALKRFQTQAKALRQRAATPDAPP